MEQNTTFLENEKRNKNEIIPENKNTNENISKNNNITIKENINKNEIILENNINKKFPNSNINNNMSNNINDNNISNNINDNEMKYELSEKRKERKKMELKTVDVVAQELLESKDENDLKEYLFDQLQLLDQKMRINQKFQLLEKAINQLNKDHIELRKCNTAVSRALNKKVVENFNLDNKLKNLNNEVEKIIKNINYHEYMGDCYKEELNKLKENNC